MKCISVNGREVKLWDDIPSDVRLGKLCTLFHGQHFDLRSLLLALPGGENKGAEGSSAEKSTRYDRFAHSRHQRENDDAQDASAIADTTAMLETWVYENPEHHTSLPLFNAAKQVGSVELACQALLSTADVQKPHQGKGSAGVED